MKLKFSLKKTIYTLTTSLAAILMVSSPVAADHSWGNYHWERTANPFTLRLGDNVTSSWDSYLATTSADWNASNVLDTSIVAGGTTAKRCRATLGRVEVCNSTYGRNGWLGIATVSVSGSHITSGTVKLNDTYFNTPTYNSPAWRNVVMCQEVGHTLGLDHQDEDFSNADLNTCMDYSNNPFPNQHPNLHDYQQLEAIYAHLDSSNTALQPTSGFSAQVLAVDAGARGTLIRRQGRTAIYELRLGSGYKVYTFVIYA